MGKDKSKRKNRVKKQLVLMKKETVEKKKVLKESVERDKERIRRQHRIEQQRVMTDKDIKSQIQHNLEILEALEEERNSEIESRKKLQSHLEDLGANSLQEKMQLVSKIATDQQAAPKRKGKGLGGSWDVKFTPNEG